MDFTVFPIQRRRLSQPWGAAAPLLLEMIWNTVLCRFYYCSLQTHLEELWVWRGGGGAGWLFLQLFFVKWLLLSFCGASVFLTPLPRLLVVLYKTPYENHIIKVGLLQLSFILIHMYFFYYSFSHLFKEENHICCWRSEGSHTYMFVIPQMNVFGGELKNVFSPTYKLFYIKKIYYHINSK